MTRPGNDLARDPRTGRFLPGNAGRPKGPRNRLSEIFWRDMVAAWEKRGRAAIEQTIVERPAEFLRIVARLLPSKEHTHSMLGLYASYLNMLADSPAVKIG